MSVGLLHLLRAMPAQHPGSARASHNELIRRRRLSSIVVVTGQLNSD